MVNEGARSPSTTDNYNIEAEKDLAKTDRPNAFVHNLRSPVIKISQIYPQSSRSLELGLSLYKDAYAQAKFIKVVVPHPGQPFPIRENILAPLDHIVYHELADPRQSHSSVHGLIFHLIGHDFDVIPKKYPLHDFSCYASTVREVEFDGHFSYVTPAFKIMGQLSSLKKVTFFLTSKHKMPFYLEDKDDQVMNFGPFKPLPQVESFTVNTNLTRFVHSSEEDLVIMDSMVKILFKRATECFTNLFHLELKLPATGIGFTVTEKILHNCNQINGEILINIDILPGFAQISCSYNLIYGRNLKQTRAILEEPIIPFDQKEFITEPKERELRNAYDRLVKTFQAIESLGRSPGPFYWAFYPNYAQRPVRSVSGFSYDQCRIRLASIHAHPAHEERNGNARQAMDELLNSVDRNANLRNQEQIRRRLNQLIQEDINLTRQFTQQRTS